MFKRRIKKKKNSFLFGFVFLRVEIRKEGKSFCFFALFFGSAVVGFFFFFGLLSVFFCQKKIFFAFWRGLGLWTFSFGKKIFHSKNKKNTTAQHISERAKTKFSFPSKSIHPYKIKKKKFLFSLFSFKNNIQV